MAASGVLLAAPAIPVRIASTVGAGDSFVAALVWRLAGGAGLKEAFRYAIGGGTAALLAPGTSLAHRDDVERLAPAVHMRTLKNESALERELDDAHKATFPASDPLAVDSAAEHAARRRREE